MKPLSIALLSGGLDSLLAVRVLQLQPVTVEALHARGIVSSMSRRGDCYDNAVAESFFATLKTEGVSYSQCETRAAASSDSARTTCMPLPPPPADGLISSG